MNWAKEVALKIINERPNEEVYTVASGVSPSGFVHIGNFREIATHINCYGNSNWIKIDNHYFSVSESYLHPFIGIGASSKEEFKEKITNDIYELYNFKPDILVEETKGSYINNEDIILNKALEFEISIL